MDAGSSAIIAALITAAATIIATKIKNREPNDRAAASRSATNRILTSPALLLPMVLGGIVLFLAFLQLSSDGNLIMGFVTIAVAGVFFWIGYLRYQKATGNEPTT